MRRVLIVSPHWLPTNAPDLHRARLSLPYYERNGWKPSVLGVHADDVPLAREPALLETVPGDIAVRRCRAWPLRWTRRLGLGSLGWRALGPLWQTGRRWLLHEPFDLVFVTTAQFPCIAAARLWREQLGVPYVVDVQDPWVTDAYERPGAPPPPGGWKYQAARLSAAALEGACYGGAAGLIAVSPQYLDDLRQRHPDLRPVPSNVIPFGASPRDDSRAESQGPAPDPLVTDDDSVRLLYTGTAGPILNFRLDALFGGLRRLGEHAPEPLPPLCLHFVGTGVSPQGAGILERARRQGVEARVRERADRLGLLDSLRWQRHADALLLIGSDDPAYVPSKLFNYALSGRPIFAVVSPQSRLAELLRALPQAQVVPVEPRERLAAASARIAPALADLVQKLAGQGRRALQPHTPPGGLPSAWHAEILTRQQCALFDQALAHHQAGLPSVL